MNELEKGAVLIFGPGEDAELWNLAASEEGWALEFRNEPAAFLAALSTSDPSAIFLMLGEREEESILLCRSIRKRWADLLASVPVVLIARGGSLVESEAEAMENGADLYLEDLDPLACFQRLSQGAAEAELVDIDVDLELDLEDVKDLEEGFAESRELIVRGGLALQPTALASMEIAEKLSQARSADYFTLLELSPQASLQEIQDAHRRLSRRFMPAAELGNSPSQLALTEISETLSEASLVLSNERLRRRYRDALARLDSGLNEDPETS